MIVITGLLIAHLSKSPAPGDNEDRDRGGMWHWIRHLFLLVITPTRGPPLV